MIVDVVVVGVGFVWLLCWLMVLYVCDGCFVFVMDSDSVLGVEVFVVWLVVCYVLLKVWVVVDVLVDEILYMLVFDDVSGECM